jgi:hypothetical protein
LCIWTIKLLTYVIWVSKDLFFLKKKRLITIFTNTWLVSINNIALGLWPILPVTWPVSFYDITLWCNQYYLWHDQSVILILHWGCDQYCLSHDQSVLMDTTFIINIYIFQWLIEFKFVIIYYFNLRFFNSLLIVKFNNKCHLFHHFLTVDRL